MARRRNPMEEVDDKICAKGTIHELETRLVNGHVHRVYKNLPNSVRDFFLHYSTLHDQAICVVAGELRFSFKEMKDEAIKAAALFRDTYNIKQGDRVAIISRNNPHYLVVFWAIELLGALPALVNSYLPLSGIKVCVVKTTCKLIIVDTPTAKIIGPAATNVCRESGSAGILFFPEENGRNSWKGMTNFDTAVKQYRGDVNRILSEPPNVKIDDDACILFTSGTTGVPKGVLHTQRSFLSCVFNAMLPSFRAALKQGLALPEDTGDPRAYLVATPLFHVTAVATFVLALAVKHKVVLMSRWNIDEASRLVKAENVVAMAAVPSLALDILDSELKGYPFQSLSVGGAPAASTLPSNVKKSFPDTLISQMYGTTETMGASVGISGADYIANPESTGVACAVNNLMIVSPEEGVELPPGQTGEIWLRGSNIMKGYWREPEATAKVMTTDGWLKTGDAGYINEEGYLFIRDRIKDIMFRGGENIDSVTVENALYEVDDRLLETAAIGVPDQRLGELVAVIVTPKAAFVGHISEEDLIQKISPLLPKYAIPVMAVILDTPMERNAAGKIMKPLLRALAAKEWAKKSNIQKKAKL